ncbi:39S ribosomal protein S30, mitochondrial [Neodiprion fabricii]|uniref:39S ribosomal protein S30, mitochondrial n=1 Tax=Neodiprion fabricii TaxID=2872261 RepID=UPI001ED94FC2|nr:39S ribosomal protein S30, mitochondrial [Neodiprion fabricii]
MSLIRLNPQSCVRLVRICYHGKRDYSAVTQSEECSEIPQYPQIYDVSPKGKIKTKHERFHKEIQNLNTVEEKLMKINMPRYYGWRCVNVCESSIPYNAELMAQYTTRTHIVKEPGLPKYYDRIISSDKLDAAVQQVKKRIEDVILFEHISHKKYKELELIDAEDHKAAVDSMGDKLVGQINRIILATLSSESPHLLEAQVDYEPRIEAFWWSGGMWPPKYIVKRKKKTYLAKYAEDLVDRRIQYHGTPTLQLRHEFPLNEIVSLSESENPDFIVPEFRYDPRVIGYNLKEFHGTNIPGFWPGDKNEFGIMSYHRRGHIDARKSSFKDENEALDVQAVFASYSWLLSQACYQGFSTFNDLTYPLVTQTVISNGQLWSFYAYQLNTTVMHSEYADENPRRNLCWKTGPLKLFETIADGKLVGFNDDVLKELIKFYGNTPQKRNGVNMTPYLGDDEKRVADIKDSEKREWLEKHYKHMVSNRPRHRQREEIDWWERIYKIYFNTRFMDSKRKQWEFGKTHSGRRYDDHAPEYIPKVLRPGGPKSKIKFRKTYYP